VKRKLLNKKDTPIAINRPIKVYIRAFLFKSLFELEINIIIKIIRRLIMFPFLDKKSNVKKIVMKRNIFNKDFLFLKSNNIKAIPQ